MEYFQIEKVTTEEEALKEMEEQYKYLCDAEKPFRKYVYAI